MSLNVNSGMVVVVLNTQTIWSSGAWWCEKRRVAMTSFALEITWNWFDSRVFRIGTTKTDTGMRYYLMRFRYRQTVLGMSLKCLSADL